MIRTSGQPVVAFQVFKFTFRMLEAVNLPAYPGSAFRGIMGRGLRDLSCVTKKPTCEGCSLMASCVYSRLFESPALDPESKKQSSATSHPFLLQVDVGQQGEMQANDTYCVNLVLLGDYVAQLAYFIHAFERAAKSGIGRERAVFVLQSVESLYSSGRHVMVYREGDSDIVTFQRNQPDVPAMTARLELEFCTPVRLKRHGKYVRPADFSLQHFFLSLLRRQSELARLFSSPLPEELFGLMKQVDWQKIEASVRQSLKWHDWTRYSSRQERTMKLGGLQGNIAFNSQGLEDLWPYLWYGQFMHVGKATSMGLGHYQVGLLPE